MTLGFLYAQTIGGWDPQQLIGQAMTVWTESGPVAAVISRKPIHLLTTEERQKVVDLDELWLDIGAKNKEEAAAVGRASVIRSPSICVFVGCWETWSAAPVWTTSRGCGA